MTIGATRLTGSDPLAVRASKRLRSEELLLSSMGSTILRKHMDDVPLWRGDQVSVRQLVGDFASYVYLPRLVGPEVLLQSIRDGISLMTWERETFALADGYDEPRDRYHGLRAGQLVHVTIDSPALLVRPERARTQMDAEAAVLKPGSVDADRTLQGSGAGSGDGKAGASAARSDAPGVADAPPPPLMRRFHGSVRLNPARVGRDAGQIAEEVLSHLSGLVGSEVDVTLEIDAFLPEGVPDHVVRTVTENSRTLKFTNHGFETE